jgi:hypothetical protein
MPKLKTEALSVTPLLIAGALNPNIGHLDHVQSSKLLPLIPFNLDLINRIFSHSVRKDGESRINPNLVNGVSQIFTLYDLFYSGSSVREYLKQEKHLPGALDKKANKNLTDGVTNLSQSLLNGADVLYATLTGHRIEDSQDLSSTKNKGHAYDSSLKFLKDLRGTVKKKPDFLDNVFYSIESLVATLQKEKEFDLLKILSKIDLHPDFVQFMTRFSQAVKDTLVAVIGTKQYTQLLKAYLDTSKNSQRDSKKELKIPSNLMPLVGVLIIAYLLVACGTSSPQQVVADAQTAYDQMVFDTCSMQQNPGACYDALENPLSVPDAVKAAEQTARSYAASNGVTIDPGIIEAVRNIQDAYQQWGGVITNIYSSTDDGTLYGWDFSDLPKNNQYDILNDVIAEADITGTSVILDIGHGGVYSSCPVDAFCIAMDPVSTAPGYIYEEQNVGATGWFKLALDKVSAWAIGRRVDEAIYRLPHAIKHQDIAQLTDLDKMLDPRFISVDAVSTLKPGGYYVVIISSGRPNDAIVLSDYLTKNLNSEEFEIFDIISLAEAQEQFSGQIQALRGLQRSAWPNLEGVSRTVIVHRK